MAEDYTLVVTEAPACLAVTNLTVEEVTGTFSISQMTKGNSFTLAWRENVGRNPTSVTLAWTDELNRGTAYTVFNMTDSTLVDTVSGNTGITIDGLDPLTSYTFGVQTLCGADTNMEIVSIQATTGFNGETCTLGINASDSYGDGWNGNAITVMQNGIALHEFTIASGNGGSATVEVYAGMPIDFLWAKGSYANETSFFITNTDGDTVYIVDNGNDLANDSVFFIMDSCNAEPVIMRDTAWATVCDSYTWNGTTYTVSGAYTYEPNQLSISTLYLTVNHSTNTESSVTAIGSYIWNDEMFTESGTYTRTFATVDGCDSVVTLMLSFVEEVVYDTVYAEVCDGYEWQGYYYTEGGTYSATVNEDGVVHEHTLVLTVKHSQTIQSYLNAEDSTVWNGVTYTESGQYTYTTTGSNGCDSTTVLHLNVVLGHPTVTALVNDGTLGTVTGGGVYGRYESVTLTALPNAGSQFAGWNVSTSDNRIRFAEQSLQFTITDNVTITAIFIGNTATPAGDTVFVHDTTFIDRVDTVTLTEYVEVHDTTIVTLYDTVVETEYVEVPVHDTTIVTLYDTVVETEYVIDTVVNTEYVFDTVTDIIFDTVTNTIFDTVDNYVYDTTFVYDTTMLTDTLWITLHDTVYIHDTIYVPMDGVDDVTATMAKIYVRGGEIVVETVDDEEVMIYDAVGRAMHWDMPKQYGQGGGYTVKMNVPASGVYLVKVGDAPARRVVVIR